MNRQMATVNSVLEKHGFVVGRIWIVDVFICMCFNYSVDSHIMGKRLLFGR